MGFGNNIERYGFLKSDYAKTSISKDGDVIYMGKPLTSSASEDDALWFIKKITIKHNSDGSQDITIECSEMNVVWRERESLTYKYI